MLPTTRALYDHLRDRGDIEEPEGGYEADPDTPEMRQYLTLKLKKKRQQMMLKRMLADSGYGDLAKMVNVGRERYEVDDDPDS